MEPNGLVVYRPPTPGDYGAVASLIQAQWPKRPVDTVRVGTWVARSAASLVAEAGGSIVGFVRVISDETSSAYIPVLVVHESWRRRGVGRQLVERVTGGFSNPEITWVLRASDGAEAFWESLGFRMSSRAMERERTRG